MTNNERKASFSLANIISKAKQTNTTPKLSLHGLGITKAKQEQDLRKKDREALATHNITEAFDASEWQSQVSNVTLDPIQQQAIECFLANPFASLAGKAGTGKTTIAKHYLAKVIGKYAPISLPENYEIANAVPPIALVAFSAQAVEQIKKNLTGELAVLRPHCMTIHRLLNYCPTYEHVIIDNNDHEALAKHPSGTYTRFVFRPQYTEWNKLPFKIVMFDEGSMIPAELWNEFMRARTDDCEVKLTGDINQLTPIHGYSPMLTAMRNFPYTELQKIHRQAETNPIIANANRITKGQYPIWQDTINEDGKKLSCREYRLSDDIMKACHTTISIITSLYKAGKFCPRQDTILTSVNEGMLGQKYINENLTTIFNPPRYTDDGKYCINPRINIKTGNGTITYAKGDKVMLLQNNIEHGLFNGMKGIVTDIQPNPAYKGKMPTQNDYSHNKTDITMSLDDINELTQTNVRELMITKDKESSERNASHIMTVQFFNLDKLITFSTGGQYTNMTIAYCTTTHKAQGDEYRNVIAIAHSAFRNMNTRESLYTKVTRAKESLLVLHNDKGMQQCLNSQELKGLTVQDKIEYYATIEDFKRKQEDFDESTLPMMPNKP